MTDIILHHYEISPYSEKVRIGLGLKGLAWGSVEIPVIMPKPDLTALTGGYRKTPVFESAADEFVDGVPSGTAWPRPGRCGMRPAAGRFGGGSRLHRPRPLDAARGISEPRQAHRARRSSGKRCGGHRSDRLRGAAERSSCSTTRPR